MGLLEILKPDVYAAEGLACGGPSWGASKGSIDTEDIRDHIWGDDRILHDLKIDPDLGEASLSSFSDEDSAFSGLDGSAELNLSRCDGELLPSSCFRAVKHGRCHFAREDLEHGRPVPYCRKKPVEKAPSKKYLSALSVDPDSDRTNPVRM